MILQGLLKDKLLVLAVCAITVNNFSELNATATLSVVAVKPVTLIQSYARRACARAELKFFCLKGISWLHRQPQSHSEQEKNADAHCLAYNFASQF